MRNLSITNKMGAALLAVLIFSGCAGGGSDSPKTGPSISRFDGQYLNTADQTTRVTILAGHLTDSNCNYDATFTAPDAQNKTTLTIVSARQALECYAPGSVVCSMALTEPYLQLNCGQGLIVLQRQ